MSNARAAAAAPPYQIKLPDRHFIGGDWREPGSGGRIEIVSPSSEEIVATVASASAADIDLAVQAARKAFDSGPWPRLSPIERAEAIDRLADALERRAGELAWVASLQMGAPLKVSTGVTAGAIAIYRQFAALARQYPFEDVRPRAAGGVGVVVGEPVGVAACITPWNGPTLLCAIKVAPALAAGCTVIVKPAPETPLDAYILAECAEEVGLPPGVINVVAADREAADALIRHPGVDKISFTGSTAVGKHILEVAAPRVARVSLELGGKSAAVVLDDADPATVVAALAGEVTRNTGQVCAALTRIIVPRARTAEYGEALAAAVRKVRVGDPFDPATDVGPLAMKRQLDRVRSYVAKGREGGARLLTGGGTPAGLDRGYYIEPTVFCDVENSMVIAQEEIFGPVASIIGHDGPDDAVRIANDTPYGLHGAVFTRDDESAYSIARRLRTGAVGHNAKVIDFALPFGGFKQSGLGREGGIEGLRQFLEVKTVYMAAPPSRLTAKAEEI
jgi:acyl-CoA reductase-like NAD-dependent aldehyde dehydrogenase